MTSTQPQGPLAVVMIGATGAVGSRAATALAQDPRVGRLTTLGRRPLDTLTGETVQQHTVDVLNPSTYQHLLADHQIAICTLGVGQPSKVDRETFVQIDKQAVLDFATACHSAGVRHFQLLSSVGATSKSVSFYLRCKGELEDGLQALRFDRLSLFHPSMILTPTNRYGWSQAVTLKVWPWLNGVLLGRLKKFRGIAVDRLGQAIAANTFTLGTGIEVLHWDEFLSLSNPAS
ncbi:MAG: NAD(P)H-binding protein [Acidobacteriota bacterium]